MLGTNAFAAKNINFNKIQETSPHTHIHRYKLTQLHVLPAISKVPLISFFLLCCLTFAHFRHSFLSKLSMLPREKKERERERGIGRRKEMGRAPAALLGPIVLCNICFVFLRNYKNDSRQCSKKYTRSQDKPNAIRAKKKRKEKNK